MPFISSEASLPEAGFVVYLIGIEFDSLWRVGHWLPVAKAGRDMLSELDASEADGLLAHELCLGRSSIVIQYWQSLAELQTYAREKLTDDGSAWQGFHQCLERDELDVWYEAYRVSQGRYSLLPAQSMPIGSAPVSMESSVKTHAVVKLPIKPRENSPTPELIED